MRRFKGRRVNRDNKVTTTTNTTNTTHVIKRVNRDDIEILEEAVEVYKSYLYEIRSGLIYFKGTEEQLKDVERHIREVDMALDNVTRELNVH